MNTDDFARHFQGLWERSEEESQAELAGKEYYRRTEKFDLAHCRGRSREGWGQPIGGAEFNLSNRFASLVCEQLLLEYGITKEELKMGRKWAQENRGFWNLLSSELLG